MRQGSFDFTSSAPGELGAVSALKMKPSDLFAAKTSGNMIYICGQDAFGEISIIRSDIPWKIDIPRPLLAKEVLQPGQHVRLDSSFGASGESIYRVISCKIQNIAF